MKYMREHIWCIATTGKGAYRTLSSKINSMKDCAEKMETYRGTNSDKVVETNIHEMGKLLSEARMVCSEAERYLRVFLRRLTPARPLEFGIDDGSDHKVGSNLSDIIMQLMRVMSMCIGAEREISRFLEEECLCLDCGVNDMLGRILKIAESYKSKEEEGKK